MWISSKPLLYVLLLVLFFWLLVLSVGAATTKDSLINELSTLESQLISLQVQITTSENLIVNLQSQNEILSKQLLDLQALQNQDKEQLTALQTTIEKQTTLLNNYEKQLVGQEAQYKILSERFAELEKSLRSSNLFQGFLIGGCIVLPIAALLLGHLWWK